MVFKLDKPTISKIQIEEIPQSPLLQTTEDPWNTMRCIVFEIMTHAVLAVLKITIKL